jgi:hypothetical protein
MRSVRESNRSFVAGLFGTQGTEATNDLPGPMKFFCNNIYLQVLAPLFGLAHSLETGAKRMVNAITDDSQLSGHFYASKANTLTDRC